MADDDMPSDQRTGLSRRHLLTVATGTVMFPAGHAAAAASASGRTGDGHPEGSRPADVARAYVEALDAGDRKTANELIASQGVLDQWSRQEFVWVDSFEIDYVGFKTVQQRDGSVLADVELTIAGNSGTVRYRFREIGAEWMIWEAVDGLRSDREPETDAQAVAEAYVTALDAGNRGAVNELIADDGELSEWSPREFRWVGAFDFEFVGFDTVRADSTGIVGDVEIGIAGDSETLRYRFRETTAGNVELWAPVRGVRTTGTGRVSPKAAADAYVAALDEGSREKTNALIADAGQLEPWSDRDFEWAQAFSIELVDFEATRRRDDSVVADLTVRLADTTEPVTYEFRRVDSGWKLWEGLEGIR